MLTDRKMAPRVPVRTRKVGQYPKGGRFMLMEFPKKITTKNDAVNSGLPILSVLFIYGVKLSFFSFF